MNDRKLIGVIPAAGVGLRISPLPASKELFPIGFTESNFEGEIIRHPKVICHYLIDSMASAGVEQIYMILSDQKWDVFSYFGDGSRFGVKIAYLSDKELRGMPYSINKAFPWIADSVVLFGMPDTIFKPKDAFSKLLHSFRKTTADLTLGLFPTDNPSLYGMVELGEFDQVKLIVDKPENTELEFMWGIACWGTSFSELLDKEIKKTIKSKTNRSDELLMGDFFQGASDKGLIVNACFFKEGEYIDIGHPKNLENAVERFSRNSEDFLNE